MSKATCIACLAVVAILSLGACATGTPMTTPGTSTAQGVDTAEAAGAPSREQLRDLAWQALDPNTSSHDLANWEVIDLRQVEGREIAGEFADPPANGCPYWPSPAPNAPIAATETYWLVRFHKRPATPPAGATPVSPTAPPNVPEPFIYQAFFLIDPGSGQVVARRLFCVIY
jgi:hypothetical protein